MRKHGQVMQAVAVQEHEEVAAQRHVDLSQWQARRSNLAPYFYSTSLFQVHLLTSITASLMREKA
jgi:hypothetical protein